MGMKKVTIDVLKSVIALDMSKGHLKWKVTDLARLSNVSRPLIYYHFGKTKKEILARSIDVIAEEFYGLSSERTSMVRKGGLLDSLRITQKMFLKNPSFGIFYLKWRTTSSPLQIKFIRIERRYHRRLQSLYPHLSKSEILALRAFLHGIATSPFLSEEGLQNAVKFLGRLTSA